jgi:hypothetical protein
LATARSYWAALLALAGAVATLAGFVYFIGALSLWIALRNRGFSADVVIQHQPRSEIIGVGLRGAMAVLLISLVLLLGSFLVARVAAVRSQTVRAPGLRRAAVASLVMLLVAGLVSWRWVALALAVSTLLIIAALQDRWRRPYWVALIGVATLTSLAWVAGGVVRIPVVTVTPASASPVEPRFFRQWCNDAQDLTRFARVGGKKVARADLNECGLEPEMTEAAIRRELQRECSVPYFGETGSLVYLGEIRRTYQRADGSCRFDAGRIVEISRDRVKLSFLAAKGNLNPSPRRPLDAMWHGVRTYFGNLDLALRPEGS